jgi:hypothetical protein
MDYSPNLSKKILLCSLFVALLTGCRNSTRRAYEIFGLPDKSEIIPSLQLGIPLLAAGFLLVFLTSKWSNKKSSEKFNVSSALVLLGVGTIIAGIIVLIPVIMWFEAIVGGILSFVIAILIIIFIIVGIGVLIQKIRGY